jgi:hypothetical protein
VLGDGGEEDVGRGGEGVLGVRVSEAGENGFPDEGEAWGGEEAGLEEGGECAEEVGCCCWGDESGVNRV